MRKDATFSITLTLLHSIRSALEFLYEMETYNTCSNVARNN